MIVRCGETRAWAVSRSRRASSRSSSSDALSLTSGKSCRSHSAARGHREIKKASQATDLRRYGGEYPRESKSEGHCQKVSPPHVPHGRAARRVPTAPARMPWVCVPVADSLPTAESVSRSTAIPSNSIALTTSLGAVLRYPAPSEKKRPLLLGGDPRPPTLKQKNRQQQGHENDHRGLARERFPSEHCQPQTRRGKQQKQRFKERGPEGKLHSAAAATSHPDGIWFQIPISAARAAPTSRMRTD